MIFRFSALLLPDIYVADVKVAMKHLSIVATVLLSALGASSPATAEQDALRGKGVAKGYDSGDIQRPFLRRHEQIRSDRTVDKPIGEPKPAQAPGLASGHGRERLSAEERRQLRRDINAAGRDIYRRNRPD